MTDIIARCDGGKRVVDMELEDKPLTEKDKKRRNAEDWICPSCDTKYEWLYFRPSTEAERKKYYTGEESILDHPKTDEQWKEAEFYIFDCDGFVLFTEIYFDYLHECKSCCQKWLSYAINEEKRIVREYEQEENQSAVRLLKEKIWDEIGKLDEDDDLDYVGIDKLIDECFQLGEKS